MVWISLDKSLSEISEGNFKINRQEGWIELDIKAGTLFEEGDAQLTPKGFLN